MGLYFFAKFSLLLYGVVRIHNMWNNGAVFQPEVLCVKLNYDRKSKDPTYFIQQGMAAWGPMLSVNTIPWARGHILLPNP